jgi:Spy/CpxP family protein refolding chaperone
MSRFLTVATVALIATPSVLVAQAAAQHAGDHAAHHAPATAVKGFEGDFAAHFKGIALSDAAKAKLVAVRDEWHAKMDALKKDAVAAGKSADAPDLVAKVETLKAQEHAAMRALLTPEQQKQFDLNMKEHDAMDAHKKGEVPPAKKGGAPR